MRQFTAEERLFAQEKAKASRAEKREQGKNLKNDFKDDVYWRELASKAGFRLASSYISSSETKYVKRVLKKINKDIEFFQDQTGFKKFSDFHVANPNWPAYALQGLMLEAYYNEH